MTDFSRSAQDAIKDKGIRKRGQGPFSFSDVVIRKRIRVNGRLSYDNPTSKTTVMVGTGDQQKTYHLDRELVVKSSKWFRIALSGDWNEASGIITLEEQDPTLFETYAQ
ncbi:hypothetical protein MBLNU457_5361t1 [Dothideomycetes sp. NU457]